MYLCVYFYERWRDREKERESVCVCVCVYKSKYVCMYVSELAVEIVEVEGNAIDPTFSLPGLRRRCRGRWTYAVFGQDCQCSGHECDRALSDGSGEESE